MRSLVLALLSTAMFAAPGDISAVRVVGTTTTVTDTTSACNTAEACNGWVLEVDVDGVATGGTYSMGLGSKNSTSGATAYCDVTSPGYDPAAATTTIVRRIYATKPLRKAYFAWTRSAGTLTNIVVSSNVATATTSTSHGLYVGGAITVFGSTVSAFNRSYIISAVTSNTIQFTTSSVANGTYSNTGLGVSLAAPYPSSETAGTGVMTARLALSDAVFQGDTLSCSIGAGLYTSNSVASASWSGTPTNSSTITHSMAPVIGNWSWPGWTRINASLAGDGTNNAGGSITVRAVAYHRSARNGKPLAAMVFTLSDGTTTVTTTATDMAVNGSIGDAIKVVEYSGTFSSSQLATLTQGAALTLNFAAYPWVGDSSAVLNTATTGNVQPTPLASPRTLLLDRTGDYGTSVAVVDPSGNDSTCVAVKESSFDPNNPPAACATINMAALRIRNLNASAAPTGFGRGDAAGTIYLKANPSGYSWTGASNFISITSTPSTWTIIRPFPGVSKADALINSISGNNHLGSGTRIKLQGVTLNMSGSATNVFGSLSTYVWVDDCSFTADIAGAVFQSQSFFITRSTVGVCRNCFQNISASFPALVRGNTIQSGYVNLISMFTVIGNEINGNSSVAFSATTSGATQSFAPVVAYNRFLSSSITTSSPLSYMSTAGSTIGAAIVQNVVEYLPSSSSQPIFRIAGDGSTVSPVRNIMLWHNTLVGGSINKASNDSGTTFRLRSLWSEVGNIYSASIYKSDTTSTASSARVGNWWGLYGAGAYGNTNIQEGLFDYPVSNKGTFQPEFPGIHSDWIRIAKNNDTQANSQPPSYQYGTRMPDYMQFVSRRAYDGLNAGVGGGDYNLLSTSPAIGSIPANMSVLPFDLNGIARRNDGQGATGAYEILSLPPARSATTFYVDKTGSDSNLCTVSAPCLTISRGVSFASQPGDIVQVGPGDYDERVFLSRGGDSSAPIYIKGYSSSCPNTSNSDVNSRGVRPAPAVTIKGFIFTGSHVTVDCFRVVGFIGTSYTESNSAFIVGINTVGNTITNSVMDGSVVLGHPYSAVALEFGTAPDQMATDVVVSKNYNFNTGFGYLVACGGYCLYEDNESRALIADNQIPTELADKDHFRIFGDGPVLRGNYLWGNGKQDCPDCHVDCFQSWNLNRGTLSEVAINVTIERNTCFNSDQGMLVRDTSSSSFGNYNTHKNWTVKNNLLGFGPTDGGSSTWCAGFEHVENITFEHNLCVSTGLVGYLGGSTAYHNYNVHFEDTSVYQASVSGWNPGLIYQATGNLLYRTGTTYNQATYPLDIVNQQPLFINAAIKDYRIDPASPARNTAIGSTVPKDRLNVNRPQEVISDIGPYEYVPAFLQKRVRVIQ